MIRLSVVLALGLLVAVVVRAQTIVKIDPFAEPRHIPAVTGGVWTLTSTQIMDVVIMGDGYFAAEEATFFSAASNWYRDVIATNTGIHPYGYFQEGFRVQAIFNASTNRATTNRTSYFRVHVLSNGTSMNDAFITSTDANGTVFRQRVASNLAAVTVNDRIYPPDIDTRNGNPISLIHTDLSNTFSHLSVVMLVRGQVPANPTGPGTNVSGFCRLVPMPGFTNFVKAAFADNRIHEFQHAFAYVEDEYVFNRGSTTTRTNPAPADRSLYYTVNHTYTSERNAHPWLHLSPGEQYNPDIFSYIGNLYVGGEEHNNVWHSEHLCLMNGAHQSFLCSQSDTNVYNMRISSHLCFWCEEIVALRIMEKTGQFDRPGDPADINARGKVHYQRWTNSMRDDYYQHFQVADRVAARNAAYYNAYDGVPCPPAYPNCTNVIVQTNSVVCLRGCDIFEYGNAAYVDRTATGVMDGSRDRPFSTLTGAVVFATAEMNPPRLILIEDDLFTVPLLLTNQVTILPANCDLIRIGP